MEDQIRNNSTKASEELNTHLNKLKEEIRNYNDLDVNVKQAQERLALVTKVASIGVWDWDLELTKSLWDNKTYEMYGIPQQQYMTFESWSSCVYPEDLPLVKESINKTLCSHTREYAEFRIIRPDGSIRYISTATGVVRNNNDEVIRIVGVNSDITKRKMAEESLKKSEQNLRESNATKDKLFSILAHDLVSPFTSVLGFSKLLMSSSKEMDIERVEEYAQSLNAAANQTFHLLTNLLEWSRSQRNKIQFQTETVNLKQIIDQVSLLYSYALDEKEIYLETNINHEFNIQADSNMVYTIIRNLVSNSIKFTDAEGIIEITVKSKEKEVEICISDTGQGIRKENLDVFENPELNFSTMGSSSVKGTGLGLLICKDFVERHGGRIWIESKEYLGTKVYFTIPEMSMAEL